MAKQKRPPMVMPGTGATLFSFPKVNSFPGQIDGGTAGAAWGGVDAEQNPTEQIQISHRAAPNTSSEARDLRFSVVTSHCLSLTFVGAAHRAIGRDFL